MRSSRSWAAVCGVIVSAALARTSVGAGTLTVSGTGSPGAFELARGGVVAPVWVDSGEPSVVRKAAGLLADDVERVTGHRPSVVETEAKAGASTVFMGTLGHSPTIDRLAREGKIDVSGVRGKWETFVAAVVENPAPGVQRGLVIVGSDRRGTAYGAMTVSQAIGVSPWVWWADAPVAHKDTLYVETPTPTASGPVVKYRGFFINDEDWGIHQWASKTFDPQLKDIGPKTYARVFELLLRLRANYLWPAMHPCSRAFNAYPEDKRVADEWGIVMGSSHCEPLLRDNVDEWRRDGHGEWNWLTNKQGIVEYLQKRVDQNGTFESVWTLGMRGIHDSGMPGGGTLDEKTRELEDVVTTQRGMLAPLAGGDASKVPQVFVPYKEVLSVYENGMHLPEDVTIMWPDDNQGYIRRLSTPEEQRRSGGGGVYYHCSYWGSPISYLWLDSTPPAQIWEEMTRAAAFRCDRMWMLNVGDIKPAEKAIAFFTELAWDPKDPALADQRAWLTDFARKNIDVEQSAEIGEILEEYYRLCAMARPEHLGRTVAGDPLRWPDGAAERMAQCDALYRRAAEIEPKLPPNSLDAYFELVLYPVSGMTATNVKFLAALEARRLEAARDPAAAASAQRAEDAWARVNADTRRYNEELAGGKWRRMMDNLSVPSYELKTSGLVAPVTTTTQPTSRPAKAAAERPQLLAHLRVADAAVVPSEGEARWHRLNGMGYDDAVMLVEPRTLADVTDLSAARRMPGLKWTFEVPSAGTGAVVVNAVPANPSLPGGTLRCAISLNGGEPRWVEFQPSDEGGKLWSARVLLRRMSQRADATFAPGSNELVLRPMGAAVIIDSVDVQRP